MYGKVESLGKVVYIGSATGISRYLIHDWLSEYQLNSTLLMVYMFSARYLQWLNTCTVVRHVLQGTPSNLMFLPVLASTCGPVEVNMCAV